MSKEEHILEKTGDNHNACTEGFGNLVERTNISTL